MKPLQIGRIAFWKYSGRENLNVYRLRQFFVVAILAILLSVVVSPTLMSAQEDTMTDASIEERHREALVRFVEEGVNPGNFAIMDQIFAPEFVMHSPLGDFSRAEVAGLLEALRGALTDFEMVIDEVLVEGDLAATRRTLRGTFQNDFSSATGVIPPNGQPIELHIINIFHFNEDGLVVEEWTQFDNLSFLTQLGVMPAPGE
jgi:predicted ester cyclase